MDIYRMQVSPLPSPKPENYEDELLTVHLIVDACSSTAFDPVEADLEEFGKLTSWISLQLSLASLAEGQMAFAIKLGIASVEVAQRIGDFQQYYGNLLDQAQVMLNHGYVDQATEILLAVVNAETAAADHARPGAHVSLASIYRVQQRVDDALYHLELGLRYVHFSFSPEQRRFLLEQFMPLYGEVKDLAGLAHCARHTGKPELAEMTIQQVSPKWPRARVMFLTSRLRALDEHELADAAFAAWKGQV